MFETGRRRHGGVIACQGSPLRKGKFTWEDTSGVFCLLSVEQDGGIRLCLAVGVKSVELWLLQQEAGREKGMGQGSRESINSNCLRSRPESKGVRRWGRLWPSLMRNPGKQVSYSLRIRYNWFRSPFLELSTWSPGCPHTRRVPRLVAPFQGHRFHLRTPSLSVGALSSLTDPDMDLRLPSLSISLPSSRSVPFINK